jgi:Fungal chitosanase of glycosyl hydrolase group 75
MRRVPVPFIVGLLLLSSVAARAQQGVAESLPAISSVPLTTQSAAASGAADCSGAMEALRAAQQIVDRDRRPFYLAPGPASDNDATNANSFQENLRQNLIFLDQKRAAYTACMASNNANDAVPDPPTGCASESLLNFPISHRGEPEGEILIWHLPGSPAFFYEAGMTIDADGAPNAYHPDNTGLDDLKNAGAPGYWEGLAKDRDGEPYVQGPDDPFPGYYVSETALADRSKPVNDPTRYVDASKIPFVVLPGALAREVGARPGDFAAVINRNNGKSSYAIFGDVGPSDRIGEGSMALAENLGVRSDARNGGARRGILYLLFPGSGNAQPRTIDEINAETEKLVQDWGGISQVTACTARPTFTSVEGNGKIN